MRKVFLAFIALFISYISFCQITYTFIGNGYWTTAANWTNNTIPPSILTAGNTININPATGDSCVLNTNQTIASDAIFNIFPGANFIILNDVIITGGLPIVTTDTFYLTTKTQAIGRGDIVYNGDNAIISKGFVWDTIPDPAIDHSAIILDTDTFAILSCTLNGLHPATTYYIKAFATNANGTGYGNEKSITVPPLPPIPVVYTDVLSDTTTTSVRCGGSVIGTAIKTRGLVWDTLPNPTIALMSKTIINSVPDTFINYIYNLQPGKTYYIRAYATNDGGTGYGNERTVTTLPAAAGDSTFTDPRDGHVYTCRQIGSLIWMTKNLNYATASGSWYYNNDEAYGSIYGRLYTWDAAVSAVPPGWHLPSLEELVTLNNYLGGENVAGGKMKEAGTLHWQSPNTGADNSSNFTALPGGNRSLAGNGTFGNIGLLGSWWSGEYFSDYAAYALRIDHDSAKANPGTVAAKGVGNSVRCIKNK